ncbi:hypothetical protein AMELA_G00123720 [Ameiurus melas]|uniref:Uncharacterized protein n=1 Tax=Ameiurus melas TaxID=219545 RepID=A0A7J6APV3_AMEME|nr:hypothetical protein AMELA_G00123720 [Ameiurus melas]
MCTCVFIKARTSAGSGQFTTQQSLRQTNQKAEEDFRLQVLANMTVKQIFKSSHLAIATVKTSAIGNIFLFLASQCGKDLANMDPADPALFHLGIHLDRHELKLCALTESHQAMLDQLGHLTQQLNSILPQLVHYASFPCPP